MLKLNLQKPSHIMLCWAGLTVVSIAAYASTKNAIYHKKREYNFEPLYQPMEELTWEERIARDKENAAKKGYNIDYDAIRRKIEESSTADK
ncbi:hypothetical protein BGZ73_005559 [Actinomortierella ambigua]|nr:hypothetical protein BGZ73_005559 [Actinomortierella ambigua]